MTFTTSVRAAEKDALIWPKTTKSQKCKGQSFEAAPNEPRLAIRKLACPTQAVLSL